MFSNALLNAIQGKGWLYSVDFDNDTNPIGLELETWTPAGEDFLVYLYGSNDDEILHSLYELLQRKQERCHREPAFANAQVLLREVW